MTTTRNVSLTLAIAALAAGAALATTAAFGDGLSREQVRADLAEARRTGDLTADESGQKLNELYPRMFPTKPMAAGKTRAQVQADLTEARRTGDLVTGDESGQKLSELNPGMYPAKVVVAGKTRAQVKEELAEARRLGNIQMGEDSRTLAEREPHRYAAARAAHVAEQKRRADEQSANAGSPRQVR